VTYALTTLVLNLEDPASFHACLVALGLVVLLGALAPHEDTKLSASKGMTEERFDEDARHRPRAEVAPRPPPATATAGVRRRRHRARPRVDASSSARRPRLAMVSSMHGPLAFRRARIDFRTGRCVWCGTTARDAERRRCPIRAAAGIDVGAAQIIDR